MKFISNEIKRIENIESFLMKFKCNEKREVSKHKNSTILFYCVFNIKVQTMIIKLLMISKVIN